ncbi:MAG: hypothetical protein JWM90_422, partial [Thermoleophilia bacterium]|nr:hypothetical protein [Thermoleophilia bacterium]
TLVGIGDGTLTRLREVPYVAPPVAPPPAPRVRHAPECRLVGAFTLPGAAVSGTLSCSDVDGDAISYHLASAPGHGTATVTANGTFTYQPAAGYEGTDIFGWYGTDGTFAVTTIVAINVESNLPRVLRDTKKPVIALKVAKFKRAALLKSGLPAAVTCNERCSVIATLVVDTKTAVRLGIPKRAPYLIGKKTAKLAQSKATRIALPLTRKAKQSVQRSRGTVRAVLVITAKDAAGNTAVRKLVVQL